MAQSATCEAATDTNASPDPPRCEWPGLADAQYAHYHDTEWGVPLYDDRALFEKLCLEGFQAGLSWLTVLRKRPAFRDAFAGFDPERIARFGETDVNRLLGNEQIIRSRAKIEAVIANARAFLALDPSVSFRDLLWDFAGHDPRHNTFHHHTDIPASTAASAAMARELKSRGFRFVGPTTAYALMQSTGMVNDHLISCHRHAPCARLQAEFRMRTQQP